MASDSKPGLRTVPAPQVLSSAGLVYAVLVGIDHYPVSPLCGSLQGAVADTLAVREFLLARGVPADQIVTLLSPRASGRAEVLEAAPNPPTLERLVETIQVLGRAAADRKGELVVHFAGHGCRAPTLIPGTKGSTGLDEALVPFDHEGAGVLHDVELSYLIGTLRDRGAHVSLVLDACHSGGALRCDGTSTARVARSVVPGPRRVDSMVAPIRDLESGWRASHGLWFGRWTVRGESRDVRSRGGVSLIAACQDRETAQELLVQGRFRGALTWALLKELESAGGRPTWPRLQALVAARIRSLGLRQTPVFEGEPPLAALIFKEADLPDGPRVRAIDAELGAVRLGVGSSLGVVPGARFTVALADTKGMPAQNRPVVAVRQVGVHSAWATIESGELESVRVGDRIQLVDSGSRQRLRVRLDYPSRAVGGETPSAVSSRSGTAVSSSRVLRDGSFLAGGEDQAGDRFRVLRRLIDGEFGLRLEVAGPEASGEVDLVVASSGDSFQVRFADGSEVPNVPPMSLHDPQRLAATLDHIALVSMILSVENPDSPPVLSGKLFAAASRLASGASPGGPLPSQPGPEDELAGDQKLTFTTGESGLLTVANESPLALYLLGLRFEPDWSVEQLELGSEALAPSQALHIPVSFARAGGVAFKIFGSRRPFESTGWVRLPPIQAASAVRVFRGDQIFDNLREFASWTTAEVEAVVFDVKLRW